MRNASALVAAGWAVLVAALGVWVLSHDTAQLRDQLRRAQFWFLEPQFALLAGLTIANLPACARALRLSKGDYLVAGGAAALALVLAVAVAPRTNRIYYDEQIYQGIGQNLTDLRLAQMCNDGTVEYGHLQCWRGEYNKQPYGYPYLLSVVYRVAGVGYWTAPQVNVLAAPLLVGIVFLLAGTLFQDARAARFAALVAALIPEHLRWSHTAASEPMAAVTGALAVLAAVYFARARSTAALAWTAVAAAFALQFRTESILLVPMIVGAIALWAPPELRRCRTWGWGLAAAVLSAALVVHLAAIRGESWGATGERLSLAFVLPNLDVNARFYVADARFPAVYAALALAGLAAWRDLRATLFALAYFLLAAGIYLLFYAGSYNYGADVRYAVMTFPPLAVLAGAGAAVVSRWLERTAAGPRAEWLVAEALGFQFLAYLPHVRATGEEAWGARADVAFAERVVPRLPRNAIVLTHNPSLFHVMGQNAAQMSLLMSEPGYAADALFDRYGGGVYLHWNFWCNVSDPVQQRFCRDALSRLPHTVVEEARERDYRFAFYRLERAAR